MSTIEEDYKQLQQLNDRLIQDKKEMEEEFKQILLAIVEEVENQEEVELGEYKSYEELKVALLKVNSSKQKLQLQQQMIEEQDKTIEDLKGTINTLKKRISTIENTKLVKLQRKWWDLRKKFRK
ncbi:MAG: hypothetical protein LPK26_13540 [Bacillaceae bacterium]|nr:hypothetical protein [Bacillaceae bacterium]